MKRAIIIGLLSSLLMLIWMFWPKKAGVNID